MKSYLLLVDESVRLEGKEAQALMGELGVRLSIIQAPLKDGVRILEMEQDPTVPTGVKIG